MQRFAQFLLGKGVFCHYHQAGGALIQTVDGVEVRVRIGLLPVGHEGVSQAVLPVAGTGMRGHAGSLVHHCNVPVLIDDVQGQGHRRDAAFYRGVGQTDGEGLPFTDDDTGVYPLAVQQNPVLQPLDPPQQGAGEAQLSPEQVVDGTACPLPVNYKI